MQSKTKWISARIVNNGMGGFLNPPGHPEHTMSVETDLRRKPENRGSMSLTYALEQDYIPPILKQAIRTILNKWEKSKKPLADNEVRGWVYHVLGYFAHCYQGKDGSWLGGDLSIEETTDPISNQDRHAGVHHLRKFYPAYVATADDFSRAYWGQ